ncbi:MAG: cytidine deaminase [Patescibacteria group bacterium]
MPLPTNTQLIRRAHRAAKERHLTKCMIVGSVGSALATPAGHIFVGANIDACCGIGFCAESSAIAAMVTAGGARIARIVAVSKKGRVLPPCGRCRELLVELDNANLTTQVLIAPNRRVTLDSLLPHRWIRHHLPRRSSHRA